MIPSSTLGLPRDLCQSSLGALPKLRGICHAQPHWLLLANEECCSCKNQDTRSSLDHSCLLNHPERFHSTERTYSFALASFVGLGGVESRDSQPAACPHLSIPICPLSRSVEPELHKGAWNTFCQHQLSSTHME